MASLSLPPPTRPSGPLALNIVSHDVRTQILQFITRPRDLINVCLVSKQMQEVALPLLYREITLDIGSTDDGKIATLMNPSNPGLKHVRVVDLYLVSQRTCATLVQTAPTVRLIIEFMPKHQLEKFRWHPWDNFSASNLALLLRNQRNLSRLEAIALDEPFDVVRTKIDFDSIVAPHVNTLGLYPDSTDCLKFSHELLKRKSSLEKLTISTHFDDADDGDDEEVTTDDEAAVAQNELNDSATRPGRITRTLFSHLVPFEKCTAVNLTDLTLEKVYLRHAPLTYCQVLNFPMLNKLKVIDCQASGALFTELCKGSQIPQQLGILEVTHGCDIAEGELTKSLDDFLLLIAGLKDLCIEIGGAASLVSATSIIRHQKTLRSLSIHAYRDNLIYTGVNSSATEEKVYSGADQSRICAACTGLLQLSLAFPVYNIISKLSGAYGNFIAAIAYHLKDLVTLQITSWPTNQPVTSISSAKLGRKLYEHMLQNIAQEIFNFPSSLHGTTFNDQVASQTADDDDTPSLSAHASSTSTPERARKLNLVAFGTSDRDYDRDERTQMAIFARGTQIHPISGKATTLATKIGWNERRWWEPDSDVLDWALQRGGKMPVKSDDGGSEVDW